MSMLRRNRLPMGLKTFQILVVLVTVIGLLLTFQSFANNNTKIKSSDRLKKKVEKLTLQIKNNPKDVKAYLSRAIAYFSLGENEKAIGDYNKAIDLKLNTPEVFLGRGSTYFSMKNYKDAEKDFSQAIKLKPENEKAYYNRGVVLKKLSRFDDAIEDFSTAIKLNPKYALAYKGRGLLYKKMGKIKESEQDLKQYETLSK